MDVLETRLCNLKLALRESASTISRERGDTVSVGEIERGLVEVLDLDQIADILNRDIDAQAIQSLLDGYDFARLRPEKLCEIVLEESIVPEGVPIFLSEAEIKLKGEIWVIHKNDADPFPSNPHAHNYQQRLKMHLGNGDLYMHRDKQPCRRLRKSVFLEFRERVMQRTSSIVLPPLAL
jgi:hypothetical protein